MKTNETFEMTAVKANVFERIAGAKRRAKRAAIYSKAYMSARAEL